MASNNSPRQNPPPNEALIFPLHEIVGFAEFDVPSQNVVALIDHSFGQASAAAEDFKKDTLLQQPRNLSGAARPQITAGIRRAASMQNPRVAAGSCANKRVACGPFS